MHRISFLAFLIISPFLITVTGTSAAPTDDHIEKLREAGKFQEAIRILEARTARGSTPPARMLLGRVYMDANRFRDAVEIYKDLCSQLTEKELAADCWNEFGVAAMGLKHYGPAEDYFNNSLRKRKTGKATSRVYSNLALAFFHRRKYREAKYAHQKAVQRDGDNLIAMMNYGVFLGHFNRHRDAKRIFETVLSKEPNFYYARLHLGYVYYRLRNYRAALREYNRGLKLKDDDFELYFYRAHVYYKLGASPRALHDLDKADKLKPGNTRTRVPRAFFEGRYRRAGRPGTGPDKRRPYTRPGPTTPRPYRRTAPYRNPSRNF